uniref:Synaptic plasticity regulator PANTS n=1 Tax=Lygus hesperus TaxID=30085 RepID=A0A146L688_LYGHE
MDDSPKSGESDSNIDELLKKYSWMVRPCVLYKEEYSDCTSIKSRFHQVFVTGSFEDCSHWKYDYDNCSKWRGDSNPKAFKALIESELKKRQARLGAHKANDVWEPRENPPEDWNAPLPAWMEERIQASYLAMKAEEAKEGKLKNDSFCVIS